MKVRNVGRHAEDLSPTGRTVGPGDFITLRQGEIEDPFTKAKIDQGILVQVQEKKEKEVAPGGKTGD